MEREALMMHPAMSHLAFLMFLLAVIALAQKPPTDGFITIDCGFNGTSYTDADNGIVYSSDEPYTSTGINREVSSEENLSFHKKYYRTVRSFPEGVRNCYTLAPVKSGSKYRVTAEFDYRNYDGLRRPPAFDLHLGVNLWTTVEAQTFKRHEIITVAAADSIQVCLVNTGKGTPFITELDLRPLPFASYNLINFTFSAIIFNINRKNYAARAESQITFPDDIYDRGWYPSYLGINISTSESITPMSGDEFPVPQTVLQTASVASSLEDTIDITIPETPDQGNYVYMHFAELQALASNETRRLSLYAGNEVSISSFGIKYLEHGIIHTQAPGRPGGFTYSLRATSNSTLPPMINAVEIFSEIKMTLLPTTESDVDAILPLKKLVNGRKNWEGDPCVPRDLTWEGLGCEYDGSRYSRITSLDLSRSGLNGQIPPSIANLTSLASLNLSYNSLTGDIPEFLGELTSLKDLNLEGNNLGGTIPRNILDKSKSGSLRLNINNNPVCITSDICPKEVTPILTPRKKKQTLPIVIGVISAVVIFNAIVIIYYRLKRKKTMHRSPTNQVVAELNVGQQAGNGTPQMVDVRKGHHSDGNQFSKADIIRITNNYVRLIGRGGFGTVYYGVLDDGTEVAVKLVSTSSFNGEKQFKAEAELLTRVHHRNLVSLLGYCNENLALVYEYVPLGSLADHLSASNENKSILSWNDRLRIALEAALGLDYLHYGCKPPIVHRDVKPANFLLSENLEVKIADFGLSRSTSDGHHNFPPTIIAGTIGYLDPEYQQAYILCKKSDVYSFGVVLLELITGKPPINNDGILAHITAITRSKMERGDLAEIADPKLKGNYNMNSMWRVIDIALSCTSFNPRERPTISDVADQLKNCLEAETSGEFSQGMSSGTLDMNLDYTVLGARPNVR